MHDDEVPQRDLLKLSIAYHLFCEHCLIWLAYDLHLDFIFMIWYFFYCLLHHYLNSANTIFLHQHYSPPPTRLSQLYQHYSPSPTSLTLLTFDPLILFTSANIITWTMLILLISANAIHLYQHSLATFANIIHLCQHTSTNTIHLHQLH